MARKQKNKQTKSVLLFDDRERSNYLRGFKKRKDERRLKAQEEIKLKKKEEKRVLKEKEKEMLLEIVQMSQKDEERLQHLIEKDDEKQDVEITSNKTTNIEDPQSKLTLQALPKKEKKKAIKMIKAQLKLKSKKKTKTSRNKRKR